MRVKTWASVAALAGALIGGGGTYLAQTGTPSILDAEGGYSDNVHDAGGKTRYGISERVARANGYTGDMRLLPLDFAVRVYERQYIYGPRFDLILMASPAVGNKIIDAGVNAGTDRAARWFQQSLNTLSRGGRDYARITVDGAVGPATMRAYASLERVRGRVKACELMLKTFDGYQTAHYTQLAQGRATRHSSSAGWITGWAMSVPQGARRRCSDRSHLSAFRPHHRRTACRRCAAVARHVRKDSTCQRPQRVHAACGCCKSRRD